VARVWLSLSHRSGEDSPACMLRLLLALYSKWWTQFIGFEVFVFSFLGRFCFCSCFGLSHAALLPRVAASARIPMAQMKPSSSRPTAVMIFLWSLPAAESRE
jgi:hypothetical protein